MVILQTNNFKRTVKRLHSNQKKDLDKAVTTIVSSPHIGDPKTGDLQGILVYKFRMVGQPMLLAYTYEEEVITLTLLALGSHENFYRNLGK